MQKILIKSKTNGDHHVLIDDEDLEKFNQHKWFLCYDKTRDTFWVQANDYKTKPYSRINLARYIMNAPKGSHVDHKNHDVLDNRKSNLRVCSPSDNAKNKRTYKSNKTTGYKGVTKRRGLYEVNIQSNKKRYYGGAFEDLESALIAYNRLAISLHGEFALLHPVDMTKEPKKHNPNKSTGIKNITFLRGHYQVTLKRKYFGFYKTLEEAKDKLKSLLMNKPVKEDWPITI